MIEVIPAVDLIDGKVVRLTKGDFDTAKVYSKEPLEIAKKFKAAGSKWIHIVDLDGAKDAALSANRLIAVKIALETGLKVQFGGGLRSFEDACSLIGSGLSRVVIGSMAVKDPKTTKDIMSKLGGDKVTIAPDVVGSGSYRVATHGWQEKSKTTLWDMVDTYIEAGLEHILCTDISKDGVLEGPNLRLYSALAERYPSLNIIASGGVHKMSDIKDLEKTGARSVVIGKAIYEGNINLDEIF